MLYKRETPIDKVKAKAICRETGAEYIVGQDYYICEDADGVEYLHGWGDDEPTAINTGTTSWFSPGYPKERS